MKSSPTSQNDVLDFGRDNNKSVRISDLCWWQKVIIGHQALTFRLKFIIALDHCILAHML
jgi:hypothetical protein